MDGRVTLITGGSSGLRQAMATGSIVGGHNAIEE
jgi:hypothetical protein